MLEDDGWRCKWMCVGEILDDLWVGKQVMRVGARGGQRNRVSEEKKREERGKNDACRLVGR